MKKLTLFLLLLFLFHIDVYGAASDRIETKTAEDETGEEIDTKVNTDTEESGVYTEEDVNEVTEGLLSGLDLSEIDNIVEEMLGTDELSFSELVWKLTTGELELDAELLLDMLQEIFFEELLEQKEILMQLFLLVLVSALLFNLTHLFENGQMTNVTFYMVYLMVFVLLMKSFRGLLGQVESVVGSTTSFMKILTPSYFLAITASNGSLTASAYYQVVLITITLVQSLLLKIGIPGIQMYVVLGIVNYLSQEDFLSKMAELIKTVVIWMTKTVTALVVGLQVIQKMIAPAVDMVKRGFIGKTASAIPGLGNVLDSVTEMTIGCAVLVRNCMGVAALVVLVVFGLGPIVQLGVTALLYRLVAAVVQPVSEKRLIQAITVMAEGCGMLLRILVTAEIE